MDGELFWGRPARAAWPLGGMPALFLGPPRDRAPTASHRGRSLLDIRDAIGATDAQPEGEAGSCAVTLIYLIVDIRDCEGCDDVGAALGGPQSIPESIV